MTSDLRTVADIVEKCPTPLYAMNAASHLRDAADEIDRLTSELALHRAVTEAAEADLEEVEGTHAYESLRDAIAAVKEKS